MNALFWPINMADYEEHHVGEHWNNYKLHNQDYARIMNNDDEGYVTGVDFSGP